MPKRIGSWAIQVRLARGNELKEDHAELFNSPNFSDANKR